MNNRLRDIPKSRVFTPGFKLFSGFAFVALTAAFVNAFQACKPDYVGWKYFPIEWYMIDEEKGWVIAQVWNRMVDPGDGSLHQAYNFTLLKYAGNDKWSYEEDIYNPVHFKDMIRGWMDRKKKIADG